jgi:hypothetical protein
MSVALAVHPVVGSLAPFGLPHLGTCFSSFQTETIHGLARVSEDRIDFLAVVAVTPGHGDFGRFLDDCMREYATVGIWEIWNGSLARMLLRRGFKEVQETLDGDLVRGMRWDSR